MLKRIFHLLVGVSIAAGLCRAETSLWKISKGDSQLYLGGTVHVMRSSDLPLPAEYDEAYAASDRLLFEADVSRLQTPEMQQFIMSKGMYTDGSSLETVLSPEAWKAAQAYCAKANLPIEQLKLFKPWLFALMVTAVELQKLGVSAEGVDLIFSKKAAADGKSLEYLETIEEHLNFLVQMGAGKESELIENSMKDLADLPTMITNLMQAWKQGNVAKIDEIMLKELRAKFPALYNDLLLNRNKAWLPKIEQLLKNPEVELVLVGVGHLAGDEGLLKLLQKRGYSVEQLKSAK